MVVKMIVLKYELVRRKKGKFQLAEVPGQNMDTLFPPIS